MCDFFGVSRQAYYKALKQDQAQAMQEDLVVELVQHIRCNHRKMGGKKLYGLLQSDILGMGGGIGRDKFFDLLRRRHLLVERRRKYAVTTESYHRFRVYKNKLEDFTSVRPHQVWVCDITYVRITKGFVYLFLITDAYSRKIVGWELNNSLGLQGALLCLSMAIKQCPDPNGLIHHSDRGFQYCSHEYVGRLKARGIAISMAEAGNCYQNAMAERVNGILKGEYGLDETFENENQVRQVVKQTVRAYNEQRPHWSLNLQIPAKVHDAA